MKPPKFTYACPQTIDDVLALLAQHGDEAKILAGGQSLVPLLNLRMANVNALIDVNRLKELSFVRCENGVLQVGALTRHRQLEVSEEARTALPLLSRAAAEVGQADGLLYVQSPIQRTDEDLGDVVDDRRSAR